MTHRGEAERLPVAPLLESTPLRKFLAGYGDESGMTSLKSEAIPIDRHAASRGLPYLP